MPSNRAASPKVPLKATLVRILAVSMIVCFVTFSPKLGCGNQTTCPGNAAGPMLAFS
jgi:hypothetical protein